MQHGMFDAPASDSTIDPRLAALRARIGWICRLIDVGAILVVLSAGALQFRTWGNRDMAMKWVRSLGADPSSVSEFGYWSALVISSCFWGVVAMLVLVISRLTRGYLRGDIFSTSAARRMRHVAFAGFAVMAADIILRPILVGLVSTSLFSKFPLYGWFTPFDLLMALFSGFVLALASIFSTAAAIARENEEFV